MRVSKIIGSMLLVTAVQTVFSANVYACRHNGKTSYSQTPGKHCTNAGLGRDRVYSSVRPAVKDRAEDAGADDHLDSVRDEAAQNPKGNAQKDGSAAGIKPH
ncbi:hypothetical protein HHC09_02810 [Neisseria meningitidis]|uniref:hypothetical protein n=1 Tax=Neisseria meningitidis TaxID=487 RepID=UPI000E597F50|nr:hypothetical protein [Neisseria meningitidis]MBW3897493.1 hypothetical protein [Neisseria meningitidis]MBW3899539.1 hypothetical protein [Neisseria meningitidis]MBW3905641.1 hypothetical protein [Neisseria meningitidis]MBW3911571.1 hypothetical protein [Neisseria meningitidis]MBW3917373.1 hypothetical protein [Neisseria meningitidis]